MNKSVVKKDKKVNTAEIAVLALFIALAFVCTCIFRIKVMFLTFDIKDALVAVAAMSFGPHAAIVISLGVSLLEMFTISETSYYGFIMNVLSTVSLAGVSSLIYKYKRNLVGAVLGLASGVVAATAVMMIANLVITPLYMKTPAAEVAKLIPKLLLPFNFTKALLNASIVMLIYKPVSRVLKRANVIKGSEESYKFDKKTLLVTIISLLVLALSLFIFFFVLEGHIEFFVN